MQRAFQGSAASKSARAGELKRVVPSEDEDVTVAEVDGLALSTGGEVGSGDSRRAGNGNASIDKFARLAFLALLSV